MARGSVAALLGLLLCFSATFSANAQESAKLIADVEAAEDIQTQGKAVPEIVFSDVVSSAGPAELAR